MARRFSLFRRRFRSWIFAFTAASALVIASGPASAADADQDRIDDALELAAERNVAYHGTPTAFPVTLRVSSQSVASPTQDWFRVAYEAGKFDVEYVRESPTGLIMSSYCVELRSLVEWTDRNGDGTLQRDEILEKRGLGGSSFGKIPIDHSEYPDEDGGVVHTIMIKSDLNEVTLLLTIAQRFYQISPERTLTPMEMKVDVTINERLAKPGARLGLELRLETDFDLSYESRSWADRNGFSPEESALNVSTGEEPNSAAVFFSWSKTATVDGQVGPVTAAGPWPDPGTESHDLILAYPQGTNPAQVLVNHDSSLGVVSAAYGSILNPPPPPFAADALLFGASLAGVGAIVAATMILANRRRRRRE